MLARGLVCRLAPKTSAYDLPQLARFLQRSILSRNASPAARALARAYTQAVADSRRSYATATTTRATKPTATVKKAVKKTAAAKAPAKKAAPTTKTKAAAKTPAKKPAKKAVAKKAAPKPKRKRVQKVLTEEDKQKRLISELRAKVLREPVSGASMTAWTVFVGEAMQGVKGDKTEIMTTAAAKFRNLTAAEREHYNHLANEKTQARKKEFQDWVYSHTPEQIRIANIARARLRRLLKTKMKASPRHTTKLPDDRQVKRPATAYGLFLSERFSSGDMKGLKVGESGKLISNEWKALSPSEKKSYNDRFESERQTYTQEYQRVYGHSPGARASASPSPAA